MPFEDGKSGNPGGRPRGSGSQAKAKYLAKWEEVFEDTHPIKKLTKIAEDDYAEFIRLGLAAMPKDTNIDINVGFDGRSLEELLYFASNGHWPEEV